MNRPNVSAVEVNKMWIRRKLKQKKQPHLHLLILFLLKKEHVLAQPTTATTEDKFQMKNNTKSRLNFLKANLI